METNYLESKQKAEEILEKWDPKSWDFQPWLTYIESLVEENQYKYPYQDVFLLGKFCWPIHLMLSNPKREAINPQMFVMFLKELDNETIVKKGIELLKELASWYLEADDCIAWFIIQYDIRNNSTKFKAVNSGEIYELLGPLNTKYRSFTLQLYYSNYEKMVRDAGIELDWNFYMIKKLIKH